VTRGYHNKVFPCKLPFGTSGHDKLNEKIERKMETLLDKVVGKFIAAEMKKRREGSMSSVDSRDSPEVDYSTSNSEDEDEDEDDLLVL
jgi:hypothetical protein